MAEAFIVDAVRTAGGRRNGRLSGWHPADLAGFILDALMSRSEAPGEAIEDVIMGCVTKAGEQSFAVARNAVLASSLPISIPAVTVDRQCGSSQQALHFAAQGVMSGTQDLAIAAGVESMSRVPMGSDYALHRERRIGIGPWSPKILDKFGITEFDQFTGAEMIAAKYGFSRRDMDLFALDSHRKAAAATSAQLFAREIVPVPVEIAGEKSEHVADEGIRFDANIEAMGNVRTVREGGVLTAANSSQICDGASAVLVAGKAALDRYNLTPIARIHAMAVTAGDPVVMLEEPINATRRALSRAGLGIGDIDLYEVNEAFSSIPMAWLRALDADPAKLNVNGGAIALGHPLGASGTKLTATLVHALRARGKRYGLLAMCEGGGTANVTIIEAL